MENKTKLIQEQLDIIEALKILEFNFKANSTERLILSITPINKFPKDFASRLNSHIQSFLKDEADICYNNINKLTKPIDNG